MNIRAWMAPRRTPKGKRIDLKIAANRLLRGRGNRTEALLASAPKAHKERATTNGAKGVHNHLFTKRHMPCWTSKICHLVEN